jgi:site-specific DNA-methyltransferase (adenine-specific)
MKQNACLKLFSPSSIFARDESTIFLGDALEYYQIWKPPTAIVSDGPYGLGSYPGDPETPLDLPNVYLPHIEAWSEYSTPLTTLWFWNSELGWAIVHPLLVKNGWEFRNCHVWDKGISHIAGNANTRTLRKFPVVTEVCVQYVKKAFFQVGNQKLSMQDWLRYEWTRTGLAFSKTNEACGMKNAATRKYFTKCHLWYFPPPEAFSALVEYANKYGNPHGRPYFSTNGKTSLTADEWEKMRAKFYCKNGITNVWRENAVRGIERLKEKNKSIHMNQKPLKLLSLCIESSTDKGDVIWEPFGGLCSASIVAHQSKRQSYAAEIIPDFYDIACQRLENYDVF